MRKRHFNQINYFTPLFQKCVPGRAGIFARADSPAFPKQPLAGIVLILLCLSNSCTPEQTGESDEHRLATEISLEWNRLMLDLERHSPGYRPPVSARAFAYVEMAAYEAALPALDGYISLENYCPGYHCPPSDTFKASYFLPAALNATYAQMLRHFFPTAPQPWLDKIDQRESAFLRRFHKQAEEYRLVQSINYGKSVAEAVWQWSATDLTGHNAFFSNFDEHYTPPPCSGCWQPDPNHAEPALLPNWGKTRSFVTIPAEVPVTPPVLFDEKPGSPFYTEAMEVFSVSQPLSRENHWIAELWSDDLPGLTVTPSGRWISIANQAIAQKKPSFSVVIETYLKTALALCDVGIIVWQAKYHYNVERPQTYIRRNIKADWTALHDNPSFPAYPSGHSAFGAAAAEVLTVELGAEFTLTDRTHENRQEFVGTPRTYQSFIEMAKENAASRVLIGVHFRMDCEEGLRLGKITGQKIAMLPLRRKEASTMLPQ